MSKIPAMWTLCALPRSKLSLLMYGMVTGGEGEIGKKKKNEIVTHVYTCIS